MPRCCPLGWNLAYMLISHQQFIVNIAYKIHPSKIYNWNEQLLDGEASAFLRAETRFFPAVRESDRGRPWPDPAACHRGAACARSGGTGLERADSARCATVSASFAFASGPTVRRLDQTFRNFRSGKTRLDRRSACQCKNYRQRSPASGGQGNRLASTAT